MFRILQLAKSLKDIQVVVHLTWIPSHCGNVANEEADKLAKIAAEDVFHDRILASSVISLSAAFKLSSELAQESWQVKWDQEPTGFFTRQLIPQVNTKIKFPRSRDVGISYCRLLLHDTMLRQDSFRTGVSDTPMCKCGMEHETAEHFLLRCPEHHAARSVMIDDIDMILFTSKCKSVPTLSEHLLLAPNWDSNLSKKEDVAIKVILFKFLSSVQRKL